MLYVRTGYGPSSAQEAIKKAAQTTADARMARRWRMGKRYCPHVPGFCQGDYAKENAVERGWRPFILTISGAGAPATSAQTCAAALRSAPVPRATCSR